MTWALLFIGLILIKRRTIFSFFSPLVLFYGFFIASILITILYHYSMPNEWKFNIAKLDNLTNIELWTSIDVFVRMIIYFTVGALFYKYTFEIHKNVAFDFNFNLPKISTFFLELVSLLIILLNIILVWSLYGKEIFLRESYTTDYNKFGVMIMEYSLLFLIFLGGVLYKQRIILSLLIAFFVTILCLGFGSRMATIFLLVYLFVIYILYLEKPHKFIFRIIWIPFIILFFGYNLSLRFSELHGLGPYLSLPFTDPYAIIENTFFNIYYTLVFGVFATYKTLIEYIPNYQYLTTSLNPSPGFLTDWYSIYKNLRINPYAPFTTIGEIFSYPFIAFLFYFFIGVFFAYSEKVIHSLLSNRKFLTGFTLFLLTIAFIPYSFEYNLRSATRYIYYALIFSILLRLLSKIKFKL